MEVSTFELLYKPLTPSLETGTEAIARRVLQGYFLTIANLEDVPFRFRVEFNITLPVPDNPARRLDANSLFIVDVASTPDNVFATSLIRRPPPNDNRYFRSFDVPAKATALVVLLPNITASGFFSPVNPSAIEIRGHVGLFLPRATFISPQPGAPARVLLTAEHRSVYLPPGWPGSAVGDLDFDQTAVALPLASGKALHEIPSDPLIFFPIPLDRTKLLEQLASRSDLIEAVDPVTAIVGGLARLDRDPAGLQQLDELLGTLDLPFKLEAAKPRKQ